MKKVFSIIFFLITYNCYTIAMDKSLSNNSKVYKKLFKLCTKNKLEKVQKLIEANPLLDINYKEKTHGETLLHCAAKNYDNDVLWYLLEKCKANKMVKSNDEQTLFSKALCHWIRYDLFNKLLTFYSLEEINQECQLLKSIKNWNYELGLPSRSMSEYEIWSTPPHTPLHMAILGNDTPFIIQLIEKGADLNIKNLGNETPYDYLNKEHSAHKMRFFAIREAFNNGSTISLIPAALITETLKERIHCGDVENYIKQLYIYPKLAEQFESPKARIFKPVCTQICTTIGLNPMDEDRCLAALMILPKTTLTQANMQLVFN